MKPSFSWAFLVVNGWVSAFLLLALWPLGEQLLGWTEPVNVNHFLGRLLTFLGDQAYPGSFLPLN